MNLKKKSTRLQAGEYFVFLKDQSSKMLATCICTNSEKGKLGVKLGKLKIKTWKLLVSFYKWNYWIKYNQTYFDKYLIFHRVNYVRYLKVS